MNKLGIIIFTIVIVSLLIFINRYCSKKANYEQGVQRYHSKKRLAILISGRNRFKKDEYESFMNNIVQDHEADIFLGCTSTEPLEDLKDFIDIYKPVSVVFTDPVDLTTIKPRDRDRDQIVIKPQNVISMYKNRYTVLKAFTEYCKKTGKQYDIVVCHRIDYKYLEKIQYPKNPGYNLYIPIEEDHNGINDRSAYGGVQIMTRYMGVYPHLDAIINKIDSYHPETILKEYLNQEKITPIRVNIKTKLR